MKDLKFEIAVETRVIKMANENIYDANRCVLILNDIGYRDLFISGIQPEGKCVKVHYEGSWKSVPDDVLDEFLIQVRGWRKHYYKMVKNPVVILDDDAMKRARRESLWNHLECIGHPHKVWFYEITA